MIGVRCRSVLLVIIISIGPIVGLFLPCAASADVSYFPIPSASTSKNDGNDVGLIVPTLITNPDGELRYVVAPMFVVNSIVGARGSINVFRYEPGGRELRFIGSWTEEIERKLVFSYADPAFQNGRYSLNFGGSFFKNATARFFGIGQSTTLDRPDELYCQGNSRQLEIRRLSERGDSDCSRATVPGCTAFREERPSFPSPPKIP